MTLQKILVATDFSPNSEPAIEAAIELARSTGGAVTLLHVCEPPPYSTPSLSMYVPSPELIADELAAARRSLDQRKAGWAKRGVAIDVACVVGPPAAEIVRYASEHEFDLLVVGSHGRHGFRRLVIGSVAEAVVRTADRPVLTVHHRPASALAEGAA